MLLMVSFPSLSLALVFLLLAEYHWKRMFKEPNTRQSYNKIAHQESIEILCEDSTSCEVIMMISTEVDRRTLIRVLLG